MSRVDSNVVYGMYSGLALLMDVHRPERPNGLGIVVIAGSGWHLPQTYDSFDLKSHPGVDGMGRPLVDAGYTIFALNYRTAPAFRYPAAVQDVQRAVRFIRFHCTQLGIQSDPMGAIGGSAGGYCASMLGVLCGEGDSEDPDPVNRVSARVQCVAALYAPSDFLRFQADEASARDAVASFLGTYLAPRRPSNTSESKLYREASPITHVSRSAPPFLLVHGDADRVVPYNQSVVMHEALLRVEVNAKLVLVGGGGHGPELLGVADPPDLAKETVDWFDEHLRPAATGPRGDVSPES